MKKFILSTIATSLFIAPNLYANDKKVITQDLEVQGKYNPHLQIGGFEISSSVEVDNGVEVKRDESKISLSPTHIISNRGQEAKHKFELDLFGTTQKKSFTTSELGLRPFIHQ